jgi:enamidase
MNSRIATRKRAELQICSTILALSVVGAALQGVSHADESKTADLLITNARILLPKRGAIDKGTIAITNGLISSIQEGPSDLNASREIDIKGRTILAGLIDTHVHLLFRSAARDQASLDAWIKQGLPAMLDQYLAGGITSVVSLGDYYPTIISVRDSINSGDLLGPRTFIVGPMFTAPGGHPAGTLCSKNNWCSDTLAIQVEDPEIARQRVRELASRGVNAIKAAYGSAGPRPVLSDPVLAAIAAEAKANNLPFIIHSTSTDASLHAISLGATGLAHIPSATPFADTAAVAGALKDLPISSSPGIPSRDAVRAQRGKTLRQLIEWGAIIALGSDIASKPPAEALAIEINSLKEALTPWEIVDSLTSNAALFIGKEDCLGKIADGYIADLVVVDGDPLQDPGALTRVVMVFKDGQMIKDARP